MNRLCHLSFRVALPLIVGLVSIVVMLTWLVPAPASASIDRGPIEPSGRPTLLQPQAILTIPLKPAGVPSPIVDGSCSATEYTGGITQTFADAFGFTATVWLIHDSSNLYVCMIGAPGQNPPRFASVYLDTRDDRAPFAEANDYALRIDIVTGTRSSYQGTGVPGGYIPIALNNYWSAATKSGNADVAEYSIGLPLTGGGCGDPFGMAVYHHWVNFQADDHGWPSNQYYDQPRTWQEVQLGGASCASGKIAYVFKEDTYTAGKFKTLIESAGFTVDLIPLSTVTSTIFGGYSAIIIADDTGRLNQWGTGAGQTTPITSANKPIIGLGEGGYAFFGRLGKFIGWPQGWHGPQDQVLSANPALPYYHYPFDFTGLTGRLFPLYASLVNEVGIYVSSVPADVTVIGYEPPFNPQANPDHAPLIQQGCDQLWGYSNGPQDMNDNGRRLFINAVAYARYSSQCPPPPPPPPGGCVTVVKSSNPPTTTHVRPGDIITYTISYTVSDHTQCATANATLIDQIPFGAKYVPNSASGGINTNIEDTLIWGLGNLTPAAHGSQTFSVYVLDTACANQVIANTARLQGSTGAFDSNTNVHQVDCPPVTPPNVEPPYAEEEVQVYPYPLVTGHLTHLSARIRNLSATTQTVTVTFQTSPDRLGIGLNFNAIPVVGNPRVVSLPPYDTVEVQLDWVPVSSGHYCIQVKIEGTGFAPIYTQRNLDVNEDLQPGVTGSLTITVRNPTASTANIDLVVDNTCPGWTASVSPTVLLNVAPGVTRTAVLQVTPPISGPPLGSGCHIDVQGWIDGRLIGGVRKLDVPPVHLPHSHIPWEEQEISVNPDPAVVGQPTQYCVELQNPLSFSRTVTLTYTVADFGAGIGFTPVGTRTVILPPNSIDKYCITWTPTASNNLHRCLLVILHQPGYQDQESQHNIDLVRRPPLGTVITFTIGNPYPFTRTLTFQPVLIGLPGLVPHITPDPPPDGLGPGQMMNFMLDVREAALKPIASGGSYMRSGDSSRVEVSVYLGDHLESGFTVEYALNKVYLPVVLRNF